MAADTSEVLRVVSTVAGGVADVSGELSVRRGGRGGGGGASVPPAVAPAFGIPTDALHLAAYAVALGVVYLALSRR